MKRSEPKDLAASVANRLLQHSRQTGDDYQFILLRYALERLMYRLSQSSHAEDFILKGAMLYVVWTGTAYRPTKDLDFLALHSASVEQLAAVFREVCEVTVLKDAMVFLPESVSAEAIREEAAYQGVRVKVEARLGKIALSLQVDIGFGDAVTPKAEKAEFPPLLDFPAPRLSMYGRETVVAEKFEAMAVLGLGNSRMKDFYDIWTLSREFEFDGSALSAAIRATFKRRKTDLPVSVPVGLSAEFGADTMKRQQWQGFIRRGRLKSQDMDLSAVVEAIREFLMPVVAAAVEAKKFNAHWPKGGPWKTSR